MKVRNLFEQRVARRLEGMSLPNDHEQVVNTINRVMSRHEFLRELSMCIDEALDQMFVEAVMEARHSEQRGQE